MNYVHANIFVRYLTRDDPVRAEPCLRLFERLERGEEEAFSTEATIAEVIYVLSSNHWFGHTREHAVALVMAPLRLTNLKMTDKRACVRALELYADYRALDLADAIAIAHFETDHLDGIYSYDRGLDQVPGVVRVEP